MSSRLLALAIGLTIPLLIGCAPGAKVVGTWDLQVETPTAPGLGGTYIPPAILNAMKPKMNVEFKENGNCVVEAYAGGEKAEAKGKWKYIKTEKDTSIVKVTLDAFGEKDVSIKFIDHNNVEMPVFPVAKDDEWSDMTATFKRRDF
jgi:hypothetical protein